MGAMTGSLDYLLGNYFHQDLFDVHGDAWAAVDQFVRQDRHRAAGAVADIETVLAHHRTESELATYVERTGCEYLPPPGSGGYRGWLEEIARRVRAAIDQR
jgi:hypothetical protein